MAADIAYRCVDGVLGFYVRAPGSLWPWKKVDGRTLPREVRRAAQVRWWVALP